MVEMLPSNMIIAVLFIEDNANYAEYLRAALSEQPLAAQFELVHCFRLKDGLKRLEKGDIGMVLLDLNLPDGHGLDTIMQVQAVAPHVPIVILSATEDEGLALQAIRQGAQDYLVKGQSIHTLGRSLYYALERKRGQILQEEHISRLALLRNVDAELSHRMEVSYVLTMALDTAVRMSSADAGLIGLIEDGEPSLVENIGYRPQELIGWSPLEQGILARCVHHQEPEMALDALADPDYVPVLKKTRAQICIPLMAANRLIGFLSVETRAPERFSADIFEFLILLASRVAVAVENAQLYQTSQRQVAQLQELYDRVSALEALKTDVIRIAAHDLRNPISNTVGYLWLLRQEGWADLTAHQKAFIDEIEKAAQRMQTITNDILSLDRFDESKIATQQIFNLQRLVDKAYCEQKSEAGRKKLDFMLNMTTNPVLVQADGSLLLEAIINLVNNAVKYTPSEGQVEVRLKRTADSAIFEVVDTGYGVPKDQQDRIFQPFFRAQSPEMVGIDGTGLGLHLVKNIIERHEGEMIFESVYGQGSTFGFRMPLTHKPQPKEVA